MAVTQEMSQVFDDFSLKQWSRYSDEEKMRRTKSQTIYSAESKFANGNGAYKHEVTMERFQTEVAAPAATISTLPDEAKQPVRVWNIGPDGTEYYAARSEQELRDMYLLMVGEKQASEDFADDSFRELTASELNAVFTNAETDEPLTLRQIAERSALPTQICSGYL